MITITLRNGNKIHLTVTPIIFDDKEYKIHIGGRVILVKDIERIESE